MTAASPELRENLLKAANELERRGWVRGQLAETALHNPAFDDTKTNWDEKKGEWITTPYIAVSLADCRVCALGALGAAHFGNPEEGDTALAGPGYKSMVAQLADIIRPGWDTELDPDYAYPGDDEARRPTFQTPGAVIAEWNDEVVDSGEQVISRFREIAAAA